LFGPGLGIGVVMATNTKNADVVDIIKTQHKEVERLLTAVASGSGEALEASFCDLRRLIAIHETAEEEVVYPVLRATGDKGTKVVEARTTEEAEGVKVLGELEALGTDSPEFAPKFEKFRKAVLEHASNEEAEVLPLIEKTQNAERRGQMGETFRRAEAAAPTHPHPHAGTSAVSHLVTGPALSIIDHVRDAIHKA
jgi:hemerythrin superfamily protein